MGCMELTRYLTGQGRSGRGIYFANNCILLLNKVSAVYSEPRCGHRGDSYKPRGYLSPVTPLPLARVLRELLWQRSLGGGLNL